MFKTSMSHDQYGHHARIVKTFSNHQLQNKSTDGLLKLSMQHWVHGYNQDCSNADLGVTLTFLTESEILLQSAQGQVV